MNTKKLFQAIGFLFDDELRLYKFPSILFNHLGELSATQVGEYIIDHCNVSDDVAYDLAVDWIDSDEKYKAYDSSN